MKHKKALIIGGGPAGLTAAYELLKRTDIVPIVFESDGQVGGLAKTVRYKGNHIDIGGHRFFSKSDRVMKWWAEILPMLHRNRLSRILYRGKFFDYPVSLNITTLRNLGFIRIIKIIFSYLRVRLSPIKHEKSLEDFLINRFGRTLYKTFFKDYTKKVWGIPASKIKPEWGAQRIKGISIKKVIIHAFKHLFSFKKSKNKDLETSWINKFWYPKFGPGQMWEEVEKRVNAKGGRVLCNHKVVGLLHKKNTMYAVKVRNTTTGETTTFEGDYVFSTMPVKHLISCIDDVPHNVREVAQGLKYRDFITVGLLLKKLHVPFKKKVVTSVPDNWIYIQESHVKVGRLQIFNNWSPYLVKDKNTTWVGLEYFCNEGDELWSMDKKAFAQFAIDELVKINMIKKEDVLDSYVLKVPKAYPVYFGTYHRFEEIKAFTNSIENLFLIGRNGMHKYNNQDHSMLAAMTAVDSIIAGQIDKSDLWHVNTEKSYHEGKR